MNHKKFFSLGFLSILVCFSLPVVHGMEWSKKNDPRCEKMKKEGLVETWTSIMPSLRVVRHVETQEGCKGKTVEVSPFYSNEKDIGLLTLKNRKKGASVGIVFTRGACSSREYYLELFDLVLQECKRIKKGDPTSNLAILSDVSFGFDGAKLEKKPLIYALRAFIYQKMVEKLVYCFIRGAGLPQTNFKEFPTTKYFRKTFESARDAFCRFLPESVNDDLLEVLTKFNLLIDFTIGMEKKYGSDRNFAEAIYLGYMDYAKRPPKNKKDKKNKCPHCFWIGCIMDGMLAFRDASIFGMFCRIQHDNPKYKKFFMVFPESTYEQEEGRIGRLLCGVGYAQESFEKSLGSKEKRVIELKSGEGDRFCFRRALFKKDNNNELQELFFQEEVQLFIGNIIHCCHVCGRHNATKRCTRCKVARYCKARCQMHDWKNGHKGVCRAPQREVRFCCFQCSKSFPSHAEIKRHCVKNYHSRCGRGGMGLPAQELLPKDVTFMCSCSDEPMELLGDLQAHCVATGHVGMLYVGEWEFMKKGHKKK